MNYALFGEWVVDRVEDLVQFGVPRKDAESIMKAAECGAVSAEASARNDAQFLLDFDRVGAAAMAHRRGVSEWAIRKQRTKLLQRKQPPVAVAVAG